MKTLNFGDCLEILKELCPNPNKAEGFIDLIYIDPPFNSKRDYNVLFEEAVIDATAQKKAFADTWSNVSYYDTLDELHKIDLDLYKFLMTLNDIHISKGAVSYLTTMSIRIWYMHKVLKNTGSFYLHCDPTMSHYLKIICDIIFRESNFRNEIIWCYKERELAKTNWNKKHDVILFYTKSENNVFNWKEVHEEYSLGTIKKFNYTDDDGRKFQIRGKGGKYTGEQGLDISLEETDPDLVYRDYFDKSPGVPPRDWWVIPVINRAAKERLGYPTQKPETLLERIIKASSNEGDLVADFFCGCGTTIAVADRLNRNWIGVDISHLAIKLIKKRLTDKIENTTLREEYAKTIEIKGFPHDIASAYALSKDDYETADANATEVKDKPINKNNKGRMLFQEWVIEIMLGAVCNPKRTADGGWDGHQIFELPDGTKETVLIEVKSGNVNVKNVREFIQVVNSQNASIGVFVCFGKQVTRPMFEEATKEGYYRTDVFSKKYPKIQILTIEDLFNHQFIKMPPSTISVFKKSG